ncbi:hypothetical protein BAE47_10225 [Acidithiobacillus thiooxidans]|uniref:hypothetical protein n=1 Tax=Acidithiobacillus thiooxidans TaxID=930 RepID=UPI0008734B74|nr:hypothetical protein [Acidithiobacillus thiooxidans]OFC45505.1 hypothetical protein BAE47_10225 [Acidithiobacillus thiooxidans]
MSIEFAIKSLQDFIRDVRSEARAASDGKGSNDLPQEDTIRVYFRNQNEVDEAYASAWVHRYHPKAFNMFPGFDANGTDPLHAIGDGNVARRVGGQMHPILGAPWGRISGGADVRCTIGIGENDEETSVIMPIGMTQAMAHLAFLAAWESGKLGMMAPEIHFDHPAVALRTHLEINKRDKVRVINFAFPAYLSSDSREVMDSVRDALDNGSPLMVISPKTAESHHYFATESQFDIATLVELGVVVQQFTIAERVRLQVDKSAIFAASKNIRIEQSQLSNMGMHFQSSGFGQDSKATMQEGAA